MSFYLYFALLLNFVYLWISIISFIKFFLKFTFYFALVKRRTLNKCSFKSFTCLYFFELHLVECIKIYDFQLMKLVIVDWSINSVILIHIFVAFIERVWKVFNNTIIWWAKDRDLPSTVCKSTICSISLGPIEKYLARIPISIQSKFIPLHVFIGNTLNIFSFLSKSAVKLTYLPQQTILLRNRKVYWNFWRFYH